MKYQEATEALGSFLLRDTPSLHNTQLLSGLKCFNRAPHRYLRGTQKPRYHLIKGFLETFVRG